MDKRDSHTGKSRSARDAYFRYIKKLDYEPTTQEALPFSASNESGEELSEPTSTRKRHVDLGQRLKDHLTDNYLNWIVGAFVLLMSYLMVDSKIDLARISSTIDALKENLRSLTIEYKAHSNKIHEQDLSIMKNSLQIQQMEKQYDKKR